MLVLVLMHLLKTPSGPSFLGLAMCTGPDPAGGAPLLVLVHLLKTLLGPSFLGLATCTGPDSAEAPPC